ncbi:hypothetical protein DIU31_027725 [Mucilaginibacter rubeus]|uniref:Porin n=1 Tax=Mucilaginibacter rubeus TaxID=2027860 RepID=A0AAE6JKQ1_9SPHI|nr:MULTISPECIES: hypothetical protein [Mucilaginibacter]NHA05571.1 hypothetical protein [Mucilaginibacter inviolabilis]QEM07111.1 hypothetical protein DIU31_027725 [Mucilaginibacter rubeus]QTE35379.1 hypothetical protein J3L18_19780 [Mucilaginibacter gossypii]QTE43746.1 hypothetical protein J3L19_33340 [Mucilaginibacter rubeus]QTE50345.1 hypothetical protein J3L21_33295 [Mucilaginibacter rubeus]
MKRKLIISLAGLLIAWCSVQAQVTPEYVDSVVRKTVESQVSSNSKFALVGYTGISVAIRKDQSSFTNLVFDPILLWQPHPKILVEAELETELEGAETSIELGYANASYIVNKYLSIRAGKFLAPWGIFQDRLHPGWINKLPTLPVGTGEDPYGIGPMSEIGIDLRGGIPLGSASMNYSIYLSNNAQLVTDPADPTLQGTLMYGNIDASNNNKTIGGRVGFLPFANSSLEIGGSFRTGKVGERTTQYQNVGAQQYALDLSYNNQMDFIGGTFDVKGQWNFENIDKAAYANPTDTAATYTFDNKRNSMFAQAAYRPTMSSSKFLKKTEFVFRYAGLNPANNPFGPAKIQQYTYGIDYWFNWRTVVKAAWQSQKDNNTFFVQVAVGF